MDACVVCEQAFLGGVVEVGAVVDCGLFGGGTTEDFGFPAVSRLGSQYMHLGGLERGMVALRISIQKRMWLALGHLCSGRGPDWRHQTYKCESK